MASLLEQEAARRLQPPESVADRGKTRRLLGVVSFSTGVAAGIGIPVWM